MHNLHFLHYLINILLLQVKALFDNQDRISHIVLECWILFKYGVEVTLAAICCADQLYSIKQNKVILLIKDLVYLLGRQLIIARMTREIPTTT